MRTGNLCVARVLVRVRRFDGGFGLRGWHANRGAGKLCASWMISVVRNRSG